MVSVTDRKGPLRVFSPAAFNARWMVWVMLSSVMMVGYVALQHHALGALSDSTPLSRRAVGRLLHRTHRTPELPQSLPHRSPALRRRPRMWCHSHRAAARERALPTRQPAIST
jgi:hypothetical protein